MTFDPGQLRDDHGRWTFEGGDVRAGLAQDTGVKAPPVGKEFVLYRASTSPTLEGRNAGSAGAVAAHLATAQSDEGPSLGNPQHVHAYGVTLTKTPGAYQELRGGQEVLPGHTEMPDGVGRRITAKGYASYSFGKEGNGYTSRHLGSVPVSRIEAEMNAKHGTTYRVTAPEQPGGVFDMHGSARGAAAITQTRFKAPPKRVARPRGMRRLP